MLVKFKKLIPEAAIPVRGSEFAAGYDLRVPGVESAGKVIQPGETYLCKLGFSAEFENSIPVMGVDRGLVLYSIGFQVEIRSRSGLAKKGLVVANQPGTIDSDYRGEWGVLLHNQSGQPFEIHPSDRIAQAVMMPYFVMDFKEVEEVNETVRGVGGLGSTGIK